MRDGTPLATDVYLPAAEPPFDVLLSRLPYDKAGDEFFMPAIARYWVRAGYAVVVQDVRGKARSGGEFDPLASDVEDGFDTIDWIVSQPWARGRVAMIGDSYSGYTQWAAARSGHPALVAITPRCASHDRMDIMLDGGVLALEAATYWAAETALDEFLYDYPTPFDWSVRPLRDVFVTESGREPPQWLEDLVARDPVYAASPPTVPDGLRCLHLCGLFDYAVIAQFRSWRVAHGRSAGEHHLVLDAVDHSWRALRRATDAAGSLEQMSVFLERYNEPLRDFLEAAFDGSPSPTPAVRWRASTEAAWSESPTWPPPDARELTWWASRHRDEPVGRLSPSTRPRVGRATWAHDPAKPVPSRGNPFHELAERPDHRDLATRPDVVQFETAPLDRALLLAGIARVDAEFHFAADRAHLVAVLLDVGPDGSCREIRAGRQLVVGPSPTSATLDLGPIAYELHPGHRLAVRLSSSLFPRYALDSAGGFGGWSAWAPTTSQRGVILGGPTGARLTCAVLSSR
jgi:uncharacterized protein